MHTWDRRDLSSIQGSQSESRRREGVWIWKLSRMYPSEKPPLLYYPHKPTLYLLAIPNIPVRIGTLYESKLVRSVPPAQELQHHFPKIIKNKYSITPNWCQTCIGCILSHDRPTLNLLLMFLFLSLRLLFPFLRRML